MSLVRSRSRARTKLQRITYRRPWLYEAQEAFLFTPARYSVVEATTKSGKTTGCIIWLNEKACLEGHEGWNGWWVAPIYGQALIAYERLKRFCQGLPVVFHDTLLTATYPNGAKLWFKSGDKPNSLYGEDVYACVIDEASRVKEQSWYAVRSTLTATRGQVRIIGNVRGRKNWAFKLARQAQAEMIAKPRKYYYAKLTAYDAAGAGVIRRSEIEDARSVLPEAVFNELYLADPTDDGGNPFGLPHIAKAIMRGPGGVSQLAGGPVVAWGGDLAKKVDYTVKVGLNSAGKMAAFDRYQRPWESTIADLRATFGTIAPALVDSTGVGDPIVETIQKGRSNVHGFNFSAPSKQRLMEGLALAISTAAQSGDPFIYAGPGDVVLNELEAFEYQYTATGVRYGAPEGYHDDTVYALALAVEMARGATKLPTQGARLIAL